VFSDPLPSNGHEEDHIENTSCNTYSIVACAYFGRCLEMGLHATIFTQDAPSVSYLKKVEGASVCMADGITTMRAKLPNMNTEQGEGNLSYPSTHLSCCHSVWSM
jgi:hypothetical protein